MPDPGNILIAGVGNLLRSDDGVGVHAVQALRKEPLPGVSIVDVGTAAWRGLHLLEGKQRVLVIDAARGGKPPGTIYCFEVNSQQETQSTTHSIHAMGLLDATRWLPEHQRPRHLAVIGVEPESLDYGMDLSPPVRVALPQVVALARRTVQDWLTTNPEPTRRAAP